MELIKVTQNEKGEQLVSGRELHEFLEVKSKYVDWFNRMVEYGFVENVDFTTINEVSQKKEGSRTVNREQINHAISLSMAKELSMIQRTEKGKQARLYFIECEKQLKNNVASYTIEDKIERAKRWIEEQEEARRQIAEAQRKEQIAVQVKEQVIDAVKNILDTGKGYTVSEVAKTLCFKGMGETNMFKYLRSINMLCSDKASWNEPTQVAINSKRFYSDVKQRKNKDGELVEYTQAKITKKGILYLYDRLKKEGYKTVIDRDEVEELF